MTAWAEQDNRSCGIDRWQFNSICFTQVATGTSPREVRKFRESPARTRNHVLEMESRALQQLMHSAVFAAICRAPLDELLQLGLRSHCGLRPSSSNASPLTKERFSLSSASAASSAVSLGDNCPSVFRSINSWRCWSAAGGKRNCPTASIQVVGAGMNAVMEILEEFAILHCRYYRQFAGALPPNKSSASGRSSLIPTAVQTYSASIRSVRCGSVSSRRSSPACRWSRTPSGGASRRHLWASSGS